MEDRVVCYCKDITYSQIKKAVLEGADTLDKVAEACDGAGTICGACIAEIEEIIAEGK